ncbi:hypothetical protein [Halothece sp. PCC 7418]|nr:hypothetical protein [Halothece sp. PCC 7418]
MLSTLTKERLGSAYVSRSRLPSHPKTAIALPSHLKQQLTSLWLEI